MLNTELSKEPETTMPEGISETVTFPADAISAPEYDAEAELNEALPDPAPAKPKRTRKKQSETASSPELSGKSETQNQAPIEITGDQPESEELLLFRTRQDPILTVKARDDVETEEGVADVVWHEIRNAYRTHKILTGTLGGIEQNDAGKTLIIVEYKGYRVVIPLKEMVINLPNNLSGQAYVDMITTQNKRLSKMLGAEIDFIVRGIDSKTKSIVASRREAMLKKRQTFYMLADENGNYRIYDGRIVQARIIMVSEKAVRIEAFGVECTISARDLSWDWIGDAQERFFVGDQVLVRILSVNRDNIEDISIKADIKSVSENRQNNLKLCRIQGKYAGKVTDVHKGVVYIRLTNGVNAIAHSCYDRRMPGKKDDVSFAVTHLDEDQGVALGIITRIIKQNL